MKQITFLLIVLLTIVNASAQDLTDYVPALNANIQKINYASTTDDFQDLEFMGQLLHAKKVIALGEATHGTREHVLFRDRMIRYLILNHNLKRIAIEYEMAGLDRINHYVIDPKDQSNLKEILNASGMFPSLISNELMKMIIWIKDYNKDKPALEKVHFEGMDVQYPAMVSNKILHTPKLMSMLNEAEIKSLKEFAKLFETDFSAAVPKELLSDLTLVRKTLAIGINNLKDRDSVSIYTQYNALLSQSIKMRNKSMYLTRYYRDKFMADNIAWIADQTQDHQKVVVWAHNGHISKGLLSKYNAMGNWLEKKFGDKYYALALLAGEGSARLYDAEDKTRRLTEIELPPLSNVNSLEYLFSKAKYENFFFNVQEASKSGNFKNFFNQDLYIRSIGATLLTPFDVKVNLRKSYDGLIFFRKTSALTLD